MLARVGLAWGGIVTSEFIYFGGTRIARRDVASGNVYYFLADRLGTARVLVNSTGGVVEESDFYPYGTERPITTNHNVDNTYNFTGHERDTESGLDHTLHRQYASNRGGQQDFLNLPPRSIRYTLAGILPKQQFAQNGACELCH
ncbi:MAG: hypothetical protein HY649_05820 [Acidobacteria bacterium]|nr:hypothetical protein [Acidobacteriota bacterium]